MIAAVFIAANTAGAIPLLVAMIMRLSSDPEALSAFSQNPADFGALGLEPNTGLFVMLFPFIAGVIAFALLVRPLNGRTLTETVNGTSSFRWKRVFVSAFVWLLLSAAYLFVQKAINPGDFTVNNTGISLITLIIITLIFIPFQAGFEELLFRGYLMQGFAVLTRSRWATVLLTALLFGTLHGVNPEVKEFGFLTMMPHYIFTGIVFGIATMFDDGIETALGAHAANNIFLSIMVTHKSSALQTPAVFEQTVIHPWIEFAGLVISSLIFLVILRYIFRWEDLKIIFRRIDEQSGSEV